MRALFVSRFTRSSRLTPISSIIATFLVVLNAGGVSALAPALNLAFPPSKELSLVLSSSDNLDRSTGASPGDQSTLSATSSPLGSVCLLHSVYAVGCSFGAEIASGPTNVNSEGWVQLHPTKSPPLNASELDEAVYDAADTSVVMFQIGCGETLCNSPQTWTFNGQAWSQLTTAGPPWGRTLPSMVYDEADQSVLLYGGQSWNSTWTFSDGNWTNLTEGVSPGPLDGTSMAYDAYDGYVLLYGGYNDTGLGVPNQTWAFEGGTWSRLMTTGSAPPDLGYGGTMVYDSALDSVVYFADSNETYLYQAGNWKAIHAPIPGSLQGPGSLAYDPTSGQVLYIGGNTGYSYTNQTYAFNGTAWTTLHPLLSPPGSVSPCLVYDPGLQGVVFFGGSPGFGDNQTWKFGAGNVSFEASPPEGGNFDVGGTNYDSGGADWVPIGSGPPSLRPNPGFHGTNLTLTGNYTLYNGSYELTGNATVVGQFEAFPTVTLTSEPPDCRVEFNGTVYSSGSSPYFSPGEFALDAPNCPGTQFDQWISTGNASIVNPASNRTTVTLTGDAELVAVYYATLTFAVSPPFEGTLVFNGTAVVVDSPQDWIAQNYSVQAVGAPGWRFAGFSVTGGITVTSGWADVQGSGSLEANFVPFPTIAFSSSIATCRSILFNGTIYPVGGDSAFLLGTYSIRAPNCTDALFEHWSASGGVTVSAPASVNSTVNFTGNGTPTAVYAAAAWIEVTVDPSMAAGTVFLNGTLVRNGTLLETKDGAYLLTTQPSKGWQFTGWEVEGGAAITGTTLTLSSNSTLTADFQVNATSTGGNGSGGSGFSVYLLEWGALGVAVLAGVATAVVLLRRGPKTDQFPDDSRAR
jgi:hypothetical protein